MQEQPAISSEYSVSGKSSRSLEDLAVWKKAHALVLRIYGLTSEFPDTERYGLVSQMRRAAVSVPANVAEGFSKRSPLHKLNFYNIAQGSLEELRYYVILARDLGYLRTAVETLKQADEVGRMLHGLMRAVGSDTVGMRRGRKA